VTKDAATNKIKVNYCVISFGRSDDLAQFEKDFETALEDLKNQSGTKTGDNKGEEGKKDE
jgi:hypothetical protein